MIDQQTRDELESLIDRCNLVAIVGTLAELCHEKAEHVATNWQDATLAATWRRNARSLERAANSLE